VEQAASRRFGGAPVRATEVCVLHCGVGGEDIAAEFADIREPWTQIGRKLFVDFAAQALREGGTFARVEMAIWRSPR